MNGVAKVSVAGGSSGVLTIILNAELQRRGVPISSEELVAIASVLAPSLHMLATIAGAIAAAILKKFVGVDVSTLETAAGK